METIETIDCNLAIHKKILGGVRILILLLAVVSREDQTEYESSCSKNQDKRDDNDECSLLALSLLVDGCLGPPQIFLIEKRVLLHRSVCHQ